MTLERRQKLLCEHVVPVDSWSVRRSKVDLLSKSCTFVTVS